MIYAEIISTVLAFASAYMATKENGHHWTLGFLSSALFCLVFWDALLYVDSLLNVFYCLIAIYGAYMWKEAQEAEQSSTTYKVTPKRLSVWIGAVAIVAAFAGVPMSLYTDAVAPYLDTFAAFASLLGMYMLARKIRENWLVWGIANTVYLYLYILQGLYVTAILCVCLIFLCVKGYLDWTRKNTHLLAYLAPLIELPCRKRLFEKSEL